MPNPPQTARRAPNMTEALWNFIQLYSLNKGGFPPDEALLSFAKSRGEGDCTLYRIKQYKGLLKQLGKIDNSHARWRIVSKANGQEANARALESKPRDIEPAGNSQAPKLKSASPIGLALLFTGLSGLFLSAYFTYAYLAINAPKPIAILLSCSLAAFSSFLFQAMAFNKRHKILSLLFGLVWLAVAGFSGAANVIDQYAAAAEQEQAALQIQIEKRGQLQRQELADAQTALEQSARAVQQAQSVLDGFDWQTRMRQSRAYNNSLARLSAAETAYAARLNRLQALRAAAANDTGPARCGGK